MSIDEKSLLCFPKPVKLHSLFWNTPLTICWMPMKSNHCCLVTTTNRLCSAFFCQSFTFPSGQMCLPAKADSSNPMSQPPTISFSLSLFHFPLPIVLSFLLHLSALAHTRWCYPPKKCSGVWREAAPGSITRHEWGHRLLPQLHMNIFRLTVACSKLESVFLCTEVGWAVINLAKIYHGEPFPPSTSFLWLATTSDKEVSIGRSWF